MADYGLVVGINRYPGCPLAGCVDDVLDMGNAVTKLAHFKRSSVIMLTDGRATTSAIMDNLLQIKHRAKSGDRVLFHYSGHGAQVATRSSHADEPDGKDEVICPVDFDWSPARMITDKWFAAVFGGFAPGVRFNWVSDSCHSGDLTRDMIWPKSSKTKKRPIQFAKAYPMPACIRWHNESLEKQPLPVYRGVGMAVGFVSGCRSDQTSADTSVNGRPCGALTHYFLESWRTNIKAPLSEVVRATCAALSKDGYEQEPQCEGTQANLPFLG